MYQTYSVRITADDTTWSTEDEDDDREMLPRCEVGRWDTHGTWDLDEIIGDFIDGLLGSSGELPVSDSLMMNPMRDCLTLAQTRDMDCRWKC